MIKLRVYRNLDFLGYLAVNEPDHNQEFVKISYYAPKYKKNKSVLFRTALDGKGNTVILAGKCTNKTLLTLGLSTHE